MFALSLFGLFNLQLPSFLLNAAGAESMKGGYVGVFLMGVIPDGRGSTLLDWPTAERVPWAALVLFAGGIALATAFQTSGLGDRIAGLLAALRDWPAWLLIVGEFVDLHNPLQAMGEEPVRE